MVFATIILAHAGLLPLSRWQGDEFLYVALLRQGGFHYIADRFAHWAPRPWSELLLWAYGTAVNYAHRPLSARLVALLWAGLGLACIAPALRPSLHRWQLLGFGLGIFSLYLLGSPLAEMFFWPSGAAAYLPTLAGMTWLLWCFATAEPSMKRGQAALALLLTAGSSEIGLFFALSVAFCAAPLAARRGVRTCFWMLPGLTLAIMDLWFLLHGRAAASENALPGPTFHQAWPSLQAGLLGLPAEMMSVSGADSEPARPILQLAVWVLVLMGARICLNGVPRARASILVVFTVALLLTAVLSRAAAYHQFGELCCQRHEAMRHCMVLLATAAAGVLSGAVWPPRTERPTLGLALLALAALLLVPPRAEPLLMTYRTMPDVLTARTRTWQSGLAPGTEMVFTKEPGSPMLPELGGFETTVARLDQAPLWQDRGIMLFFHKRAVTIVRSSP